MGINEWEVKERLTCGQLSLSKLEALTLDLPNSQTNRNPVNICGVSGQVTL